jgi:hypothetical protein
MAVVPAPASCSPCRCSPSCSSGRCFTSSSPRKAFAAYGRRCACQCARLTSPAQKSGLSACGIGATS